MPLDPLPSAPSTPSAPRVPLGLATAALSAALASAVASASEADAFGDLPLESLLGEPALEVQQVLRERFPNLVVALDGTVVATSGRERFSVRRSEDGGATWGPEIVVAEPGFHGGGALVDESDGRLLVFFHDEHPPGGGATAPFSAFASRDHGLSWEEIESEILADELGYVPALHMSENGLTLRRGERAGRLLRPARVYGVQRGYNTALYSDDGGATWRPSAPFPEFGTGEGAVAELSDGRVYYNSRLHRGSAPSPTKRRDAYSLDGGETWTGHRIVEALPDGPQSSAYGCMAGLVRVPAQGRDILLFSNLDTPGEDRERLTVWASFDGGQTWPLKRLVHEGRSAYSSLACGRAGTSSEGWIYLQFEGGGSRVARFNLAWVLGGEATGDGVLPDWLP